MSRTVTIKKCINCQKVFETFDKRKKFCGLSCSSKYNNSKRSPSEDTKKAISKTLKEYYSRKEVKTKHSVLVGELTKGKYNKNPDSLKELSKRTTGKILKRMQIKCSLCGWNRAVGDLHHINGRKIKNADSHENLAYLCPNCHREVHSGLINKSELITLQTQIGDSWKKYYYG